MRMRYCPYCGGEGSWEIPRGDQRSRLVCGSCGVIHYQNPQVIAGCVAEYDGRILMCRRSIEPRAGCWTLPAGYLETGETIQQAAVRETWEETGVRVTVSNLYSLFSVTERDHVYVIFRGHADSDQVECGEESSEVAFLPPSKIPWNELAYPVIEHILQRYVKERAEGVFGLYVGARDGGTLCDVGVALTYELSRFNGVREG